ncbi:MAG: tetratricopeptide repeat protein [Proteobacteria bacterium]|nr:tetratricopeptide repeat protein [Pseudomonadota bacterium]
MNRTMQILLGLFTLLIPLFVFAPTFHGTGLWDDSYFIFDRYHDHSYTYSFFWKHALWPFFESTTLTLYRLFGTNTSYWHLTNFILHLVNGWLLGKVVKKFKPKLATPLMMVFWIHPLCALTVGWLVQLKTLMSFFFGLMAVYLLVGKTSSKRTMALSCLLFFFSITSKSATIILPFVALAFVGLRKSWRPHCLKLVPFIAISVIYLIRMSFHDDLQITIKNSEATITTLVEKPVETPLEAPVEMPAEAPVKATADLPPVTAPEIATAPAPEIAAPLPEVTEEKEAPLQIELPEIDEAELTAKIESYTSPTKLKIMAYTTSYYLAAPWLPIDLSPIHSNYRGGYNFKNYLGFLILITSVALLFWKRYWPALMLMAQLIVLAPFLGLIAAPYMTFSIVSEQHLYLALPFAILMQLMLLEKIFKSHVKIAYFLFFIALSAVTANYTPTFKNEEQFYRRVLSVYPHDRLSVLNLANHYYKSGRIKQALFVLNKAIQQSEEHPYLKEDIMHPYIMKSFEQMSLFDIN